jgi:hypothetical protein
MDFGAARFELARELFEIAVEMINGVPLGLGGSLAGGLPVVEGGLLLVAGDLVFLQCSLDETAMAQVARDRASLREEFLGRGWSAHREVLTTDGHG